MKKISLLLIALGTIFSVLTGRFEYIPDTYFSFEWRQVHFSILNAHGGGADDQYVNTAIVGYAFLLLFGLINIAHARKTGFIKTHLLFVIVTTLAILFEVSSFLLLFSGKFHGIHIQIGLLLVIWALLLLDRIYSVFQRATLEK